MTRTTSQAIGLGGSIPVPPADPGTSVRTSFDDQTGQYHAKKTLSGVINKGTHMFHSMFVRCDAVDTFGYVKIDLTGVNALFQDTEYRVDFSLVLDSTGTLVDASSYAQIITDSGGQYNGLSRKLFFAPTLVTIKKKGQNGLWVSWYYDLNNTSSFKVYLNTVEMRDPTTEAATSEVLSGESFQTAYGVVKGATAVDSMDVAHQWFETAVDGTELGLEDWRWGFVDENDNYAPKELGDGTVGNLAPHLYLSAATHPLYDEADDDWFFPADSNVNVSGFTGVDETLRWYGGYKKSYINNPATMTLGSYTAAGATFVCFGQGNEAKTNTGEHSDSFASHVLVSAGELGSSNSYLMLRSRSSAGYFSNAQTGTGLSITRQFTRLKASCIGSTSATYSFSYHDDTGVALGMDAPTSTSDRLNWFVCDLSGVEKTLHVYCFNPAATDITNPQIDSEFFDGATVKEPNIDGSGLTSTTATLFINAALGLGCMGTVFAGELITPSSVLNASANGSYTVFNAADIQQGDVL